MRAAWPQVGRGHTGGRTSENPIQAKFAEFLFYSVYHND